MTTQVINLVAGPGAGKSTIAAGLFYELKVSGINAELVTEFVKSLAWEGITPNAFDQPYIFGQQAKRESSLYNKVDILVTDSPLILSPIYEAYYNQNSVMLDSVFKFLERAKENGVEHKYFFLNRTKPYVQHGRFESYDVALTIDNIIKTKLVEWNIPFFNVDCGDINKVKYILSKV